MTRDELTAHYKNLWAEAIRDNGLGGVWVYNDISMRLVDESMLVADLMAWASDKRLRVNKDDSRLYKRRISCPTPAWWPRSTRASRQPAGERRSPWKRHASN